MLLFTNDLILEQKHGIASLFLMSPLCSSCLVPGLDRSLPQLTSIPVSWHLRVSARQQVIHLYYENKFPDSSLAVFTLP